MKHKIIIIIAALVAGISAVGCGSRSAERETAVTPQEAEEQNTRLAEALNVGNISHASEMADSMSLFVDDFTPEQTVQVLMAFLTVHNDAVAKKESRRDLETIRKYIDVYDIALSVNPKDTRSAFEKARKLNPSVDFDSIARVFRDKLTQYDAIHDGSMVSEQEEEEAAPTDSTDVKSDEEIPLELRPAD